LSWWLAALVLSYPEVCVIASPSYLQPACMYALLAVCLQLLFACGMLYWEICHAESARVLLNLALAERCKEPSCSYVNYLVLNVLLLVRNSKDLGESNTVSAIS